MEVERDDTCHTENLDDIIRSARARLAGGAALRMDRHAAHAWGQPDGNHARRTHVRNPNFGPFLKFS